MCLVLCTYSQDNPRRYMPLYRRENCCSVRLRPRSCHLRAERVNSAPPYTAPPQKGHQTRPAMAVHQAHSFFCLSSLQFVHQIPSRLGEFSHNPISSTISVATTRKLESIAILRNRLGSQGLEKLCNSLKVTRW